MFEKDHVFLLPYPVKRMVEMGKEILQKNNVTDLSDVRWDTFTVNSSSRWWLVVAEEFATMWLLQSEPQTLPVEQLSSLDDINTRSRVTSVFLFTNSAWHIAFVP